MGAGDWEASTPTTLESEGHFSGVAGISMLDLWLTLNFRSGGHHGRFCWLTASVCAFSQRCI